MGAILLLPHASTHENARRAAYWSLHLWQTTFDACSAACGAGLLTYHPIRDYTHLGIATLTLIAVAGAVWFVGACANAEAKLGIAPFCASPRPAATARAAWLISAGFCAAIASIAAIREDSTTPWLSALFGLRTAAGFGAAASESLSLTGALCAFALLGPSVISLCLLWRSFGAIWRPMMRQFAFAAGLLLLLAFTNVLFEQPRRFGAPARGADPAAITPDGVIERGIRASYAIVGAANGVGGVVPLDSSTRDGTRVILAAAILAGGGAGSAAGGLRWTLLAALFGTRRTAHAGDHPHAIRGATVAARRTLRALLILTGTVAIGILLIDSIVGVRFGRPIQLGDALLDAASAVGGAGLGGEAVATITSRNLSTGIGHASDLYPYGMLWVMLAMVLGRLVPLWMMQRAARHMTPQQREGAA